MAYTPINWQTGDTITAEKMNKMDNGWSVSSSSVTYIDNASVTTTDTGEGAAAGPTPYMSEIADDSITVVFNGTTYICAKGGVGYGAVENGPVADFTTYPFGLVPLGPVLLLTETAGTYTITVSASSTSVETSDAFSTAVESVVDTSTMPMLCVSGETTHDDMAGAIANGRILCFDPFGVGTNMYFITSVGSESVTFIPQDAYIQASFLDGVFVVSYT